jgi:hypothetical protein
MSFRDDFLLHLVLRMRLGLNGCVCELVRALWLIAFDFFLKILVLNTCHPLANTVY